MIIRKIKKIFYLFYSLLKSKEKLILKEQLNLFKKNNLDRQNGLEILKKLHSEFKWLNTDMHSEHQVIFSSISEKKDLNINKILEIGTYDGKNAFLLSKLFPNSEILTIDLPDNSEDYKNTYNRANKNKLDEFVQSRNKIISSSNNVIFKQINSINLMKEKNQFDLIWIDGSHGYPVVTIDIINSIRLSRKNGFVLCDDVYINKLDKQDKNYFSNAAFETMTVLRNEKFINFDLFFKRLDNKYNYFPTDQKFIALLKILN